MKRRVISMLIAVLVSVPLLTIQAYAETFEMGEITGLQFLPEGYVYPSMRYMQNDDLTRKEMMIYDARNQVYVNVNFNGDVTVMQYSVLLSYFKFSDPASVRVRVYECSGREIFTVSPEHQMKINIPSGELAKMTGLSIYGTIKDWVWDCELVPLPNGGYALRPYKYYVEDQVSLTTSDVSIVMNALNIPITVEEFASKSVDYYVSQRQGSGVKTTIDYQKEFNVNNGLLSWADGNGYIYGYPLSLTCFIPNSTSFKYSLGSAYTVSSSIFNIVLNDAQLIKGKVPKPSLNVLNQMLRHFNMNEVFFSDGNDALSGDISGLGDTMGDWAGQAGQFESQAGTAVTGVTAAVVSFNPLFMSVWNILPPWFYALLAVSLVFVIGRKILGR